MSQGKNDPPGACPPGANSPSKSPHMEPNTANGANSILTPIPASPKSQGKNDPPGACPTGGNSPSKSPHMEPAASPAQFKCIVKIHTNGFYNSILLENSINRFISDPEIMIAHINPLMAEKDELVFRETGAVVPWSGVDLYGQKEVVSKNYDYPEISAYGRLCVMGRGMYRNRLILDPQTTLDDNTDTVTFTLTDGTQKQFYFISYRTPLSNTPNSLMMATFSVYTDRVFYVFKSKENRDKVLKYWTK